MRSTQVNEQELQEIWQQAPRVVRDANRIIGFWGYPWALGAVFLILLSILYVFVRQRDLLLTASLAILFSLVAWFHFHISSQIIFGKIIAWRCAIFLSVLHFLLFPIGTVTSILIWSRWFKSATMAWFSEDRRLPDLRYTCPEAGLLALSIAAAENAVREQPQNAHAHYELGTAYFTAQRYGEAVEAYQHALSILPDLAEANLSLGAAFGELGNRLAEIAAYKRAVEIDSGYADAHFELGLTYAEDKNRTLALDQYRILVSLDRLKSDELLSVINKSSLH